MGKIMINKSSKRINKTKSGQVAIILGNLNRFYPDFLSTGQKNKQGVANQYQ